MSPTIDMTPTWQNKAKADWNATLALNRGANTTTISTATKPKTKYTEQNATPKFRPTEIRNSKSDPEGLGGTIVPWRKVLLVVDSNMTLTRQRRKIDGGCNATKGPLATFLRKWCEHVARRLKRTLSTASGPRTHRQLMHYHVFCAYCCSSGQVPDVNKLDRSRCEE